MESAIDRRMTDEWLEADGLGGFASGTAAGIRTRRYHGLLLPATTPPTGRVLLVNGLEVWVETPTGRFALSSQRYAPGVVPPDGAGRIVAFETDPWPRWRFHLEDGTAIEQEIFVRNGAPLTVIAWRLTSPRSDVRLSVHPFFSGRDYHALHHENGNFRFEPDREGGRLLWRPYEGVPGVVVLANGAYTHQPEWYRNFLYEEERARGLDFTEDLASPGSVQFDLSLGEAVLILTTEEHASASLSALSPEAHARNFRTAEQRRRRFPSRLHRAADTYFVRRGGGQTIVAGYPWFTDWGRDTFIALRGVCLATGRFEDARQILLEWAGAVSDGMLPNRFPDRGEAPEFNAVDAALWYVVAVHAYQRAAEQGRQKISAREQATLRQAIDAILTGYAKGTRFGIRLDDDGLLAAGEPGVQLTWMDAKVRDWVVTPRIGKPVEVEALWLNALRIGGEFRSEWHSLFARGTGAFRARFWNEPRGCLYDVVDADHRPGTADATFRPNQIFAVGGLPFPLLEGDRARRVVDAVEARLWTPLGLRSLAPGELGYTGRYEGGVHERDGAYHQGTVWPWLIGPFVEAWVRVRRGTREAKREARSRFLDPLLAHLDEAGLGHISEIADGDPHHTPRGCPFQAWSIGEALRLAEVVLAEPKEKAR